MYLKNLIPWNHQTSKMRDVYHSSYCKAGIRVCLAKHEIMVPMAWSTSGACGVNVKISINAT